jgi:hypothetical protein
MATSFEQAYARMVARRNGLEQSYLHVTFLCRGRVVREQILEERYACRVMEAWTARGPEYRVRNRPFTFPRAGVAAKLLRMPGYRREARRFVA